MLNHHSVGCVRGEEMLCGRGLWLLGTCLFGLLMGNWQGVRGAEEQGKSHSRPNVLFIAIDDLRNDLGYLGVQHARTPELDRFSRTARLFDRHYVQVPTCGASRCALMRGRYPDQAVYVRNDAIKQTHADWGAQSLPAIFRQQGYRTLALGKITHHPGGLTGPDWAEGPEELPEVWERSWIPDGPWKTPLAIMHGYANGQPRQPGRSPAWEAFDGPDEAYPDAWVAAEAVRTLQELSQQQRPWFFGVGFFKPHLPFAAPLRWHELHAEGVPDLPKLAARKPNWPSGWHKSGEFRRNYGHPADQDPDTHPEYARRLRQAYAASVSYVDAQIGRLLRALEESPARQNTIVVIWSDHGFLLGEHAIWGKHCLYEQALLCPLWIRTPDLPQPGEICSAVVETVDILPTLAELCQLVPPEKLDGRSLKPHLLDPRCPSSKPARGFWTNNSHTLRDDRWRLIVHPRPDANNPQLELFDYQTDPLETKNHADSQPEIVQRLLQDL